jgi:hypothetical protein
MVRPIEMRDGSPWGTVLVHGYHAQNNSGSWKRFPQPERCRGLGVASEERDKEREMFRASLLFATIIAVSAAAFAADTPDPSGTGETALPSGSNTNVPSSPPADPTTATYRPPQPPLVRKTRENQRLKPNRAEPKPPLGGCSILRRSLTPSPERRSGLC